MNTGTEIQKRVIEKKVSGHGYTEEAMKNHEKGMRAVQVTLPDSKRENFVTTKGTFKLDLLRVMDWRATDTGWRTTFTGHPGTWWGSRTGPKTKAFLEPNGITPTSTERNPQKLGYLRGLPPRRQESPGESAQFTTYF